MGAKEHLKKFINEQQYNYNSKSGLNFKMLESADIVVRVVVNVFNEGFWNRDICRVLYEFEDGRLYIKRLEDGHEGIVSKQQVKYPKWEEYEF